MRIVHVGSSSLTSWKGWGNLERRLGEEDGFDDIGGRNSAERLEAIYQEGNAVLGLDEENAPVGFVAAWPTENSEFEIGSVWVHPSWRRRGWGSRLTHALIHLPEVEKKQIFAISQTHDFWRVAAHVGLRLHGNWREPISWASTCEPCSKVMDKAVCPLRNKTCKLFIR